VRPVLIVVGLVLAQDSPQMVLIPDEGAIRGSRRHPPIQLRISHTVDAATFTPRSASSPWSSGSPTPGSPRICARWALTFAPAVIADLAALTMRCRKVLGGLISQYDWAARRSPADPETAGQNSRGSLGTSQAWSIVGSQPDRAVRCSAAAGGF
jgi:hypothetical protein